MAKWHLAIKITFNVFSLIYRVVLGLTIPVLLMGNFLTASGGHNKKFNSSDYLFFAYSVATIFLLTLYQKLDEKDTTIGKKILLYIVLALVLGSLGFGIYSLYDTYFICKCFTTGDDIGSLLIILFLIVTLVVFFKLFVDIVRLNKKKKS